jgi:hypothetical protein
VAAGLWIGRPAARVAGIVVGLAWAIPGVASAPVTGNGALWVSWLAAALGTATFLACIAPLPRSREAR